MLNSLINVGLLVMGVGAKASTPINLDETQEKQEIRQVETSQEQTRTVNNDTYNITQIINYNGAQTGSLTSYEGDSPAFQPTTNTGPWHYNSSERKAFLHYAAPFTIQGATQENRIVNGYGTLGANNRPIISTYDLSTLNFYDAYMLKATAFRISTEQPTITSKIYTSNTAYIGYYNYEDHAFSKNIHIETYAYIGYDNAFEYVFNLIYHNDNILTDAFNYCNNTPASFNLIYQSQTMAATFASQTNGVVSANVEREYDINLFTSGYNYLIEFTAFRVLDTQPFEFKDQNISLRFGSSTPPTTMGANDLANFVYVPNVNNPTRFEATYKIVNVTQEMINLPGLMWDILAMPFSFISQAFNLTLFPGTPYQINFANLFLSIFGVLVFIFIFKLILKR